MMIIFVGVSLVLELLDASDITEGQSAILSMANSQFPSGGISEDIVVTFVLSSGTGGKNLLAE